MLTKTLVAMALIAGLSSAAQASGNLVTNGSFESATVKGSFEFGNSYLYPNGVTGWSSPSTTAFNVYWDAATATTVNADTRYTAGEPQKLSQLPSVSPDGGNFVGLDGDTQFNGPLTQMISGLTVGKDYKLTFDWAATQLSNRFGDTTEFLRASFGGQSFDTPTVAVPTHGFEGWFTESFVFKATNTNQLLSFLSIGTPNGLPPFAVLDGVSLTAVPEAPVWGMLIMGFGLVGFAQRRRAAEVVAA